MTENDLSRIVFDRKMKIRQNLVLVYLKVLLRNVFFMNYKKRDKMSKSKNTSLQL